MRKDRMSDYTRLYTYYLKRCNEMGVSSDLFDIEKETDTTLTYSEMVEELEDKFFSKVKKLEMNKNQTELKTPSIKKGIEELAKARSIYVFGSPRTGKSAFVFSLCKQLQTVKPIYYFDFPKYKLLWDEGFKELESLDELTHLSNAVVVIDEATLLLRKGKASEELQKILTLAGQNELTIIIITQISQIITATLEGLIDCYIIMDCDYENIKNGSRLQKIIKNFCQFNPENFKLNKGEFLFYSRNFPVFNSFDTFKLHPKYTEEWSLAYKTPEKKPTKYIIEKIKL